jgi:GH15 family glucan-1,4-alpha-glucosidase
MFKSMDLHRKSVSILEENQHESGAFVTAPGHDTYRPFCWIRDGSFCAYALDLAGMPELSEGFHSWVNGVVKMYSEKIARVIEPGGSHDSGEYLHPRFRPDGSEGETPWQNFQLDCYGQWLWALAQHVEGVDDKNLIDRFYSSSINPLVKYLTRLWQEPCSDCWEEYPRKIHPSTIASVAGGLKAMNTYLNDGDVEDCIYACTDFLINECTLDNTFVKFIGSDKVDASLIWLSAPFDVIDVRDPIISNTVGKIEGSLVSEEGGCKRNLEDTYYGGGEWIPTTGFLGWHKFLSGDKEGAKKHLRWIEEQADSGLSLPEQVPKNLNAPIYYKKWRGKWGEIAKPLLWSHAMYLINSELID